MGEWKGSWSGEKDYYCKDGRGDKSISWKKSQSHVSGSTSCLSTEKEFILYLTSIPWWRLRDAQKFKRTYKNIDEWDDSGALESFRTARSRFETLHYRTEITVPQLPDPDMFIDRIDHDLVIDRETMEEIERALKPVETAELARTGFGTSGWESLEFAEKSIPVSGWESWGDNEEKEKEKEKENESNNWDKYVEKESESKNWDKYVEKESESKNWDKYVEKGNDVSNWDRFVEKENDFSNGWEKKGDCFDDNSKWNNGNRGCRNNEASCSLAWDKWDDRYNSAWNNSWSNENKRVWGNNEVSCSSSWEREEYSYNKAWNNNSWDRRNSDWKRRNVRKRDGNGVHAGFRVRKIRFKGEGCNNWKGSRGRNNNPTYPYNIAYT
ncbi:hypothetical protein LUZ60_015556 [Juncus effusus]|nr:hypothetical protein LUZ60_015556 [Juncus effusus]